MQRPPIPIAALGVFASLAALIPVGYLVIRMLEGCDKALQELARPQTLGLLVNTLGLTITVALSALVIGFLQAWITTRTAIPFAGLNAVLSTLPLAIPSYVLAMAFTTFWPGFQGFGAAWFTLTIATSPYVYLAVSVALVRINVANEEMARSLGSSVFQVLRKVTWPQVKPAAFGSLLLVVMYVLSEFGAVALLRFDTFTRAIYNAYRGSFDRTSAAALAILLLLLTLFVLYLERRYRGDYTQVPQSMRRTKISLGKWRFGVVSILMLYFLLSVVLPVLALAYWALVGSSESNWQELIGALGNSLFIAFIAGGVIGIFAIAIAVWQLKYQSATSNFVSGSVWASHALPAVVVGLALVFVGANLTPVIYQTIWLLLIAYLILFLPNALGAITTPLAQVPNSLEQVAGTMGFSKTQAIYRVLLPAAKSGVLAGVSLAALAVLKELPATLLLHPTGMETLATELWQATETLSYSKAAPYALALIIIAGVPALVLNRQARRLVAEVSAK